MNLSELLRRYKHYANAPYCYVIVHYIFMFKIFRDPKFEGCMAVTVRYILLWIVISYSLIGVVELSEKRAAFLLVVAALKTVAAYSCKKTKFYHTTRIHIQEDSIVLTS
jgi:hypothetical protein